jgi:hypothetical protein
VLFTKQLVVRVINKRWAGCVAHKMAYEMGIKLRLATLKGRRPLGRLKGKWQELKLIKEK